MRLRPSAPGIVIPNAETWLDFADLVLIDPVGTGYSRFEDETAAQTDTAGGREGEGNRRSTSRSDVKKQYWSINGDADALASFIAQWLTKTGRHASPKVIVGESYGGFRGPKIARTAATGSWRRHQPARARLACARLSVSCAAKRHLPFNAATLLPSLSAASLELRGKTPTAALMREAEDYARGEYLTDMLRGPRDTAAAARVVKRVAALTGLPAATVAKYGGMLDSPGYGVRSIRKGTRSPAPTMPPSGASLRNQLPRTPATRIPSLRHFGRR